MEKNFTPFTDEELIILLGLIRSEIREFRKEYDYYANVDPSSSSGFDIEEINDEVDYYGGLISKYDCIADKIRLLLSSSASYDDDDDDDVLSDF